MEIRGRRKGAIFRAPEGRSLSFRRVMDTRFPHGGVTLMDRERPPLVRFIEPMSTTSDGRRKRHEQWPSGKPAFLLSPKRGRNLAMAARGILYRHGPSPVTPRSFSLKCGERQRQIMMFEETVPAGPRHLPSASRQRRGGGGMALVLSGEVTVQDRRERSTSAPRQLRLHAARRAACWKSTRGNGTP